MPLSPEGRVLRWGCACRHHPTILGVSNRGSSISSKAVGRTTTKSGCWGGTTPTATAHCPQRVWHTPGQADGVAMSHSCPKLSIRVGQTGWFPWCLGVAVTPAHHVPAGWTHPPVFDTLHLPQQLQGFLQELATEI